MKRITNPFVWMLMMLLTTSCSDVFEESIEGKIITINAPGDSSQNYGITFWWNPIDGALKYNLQVVAPDFNNVSILVLDTMLQTDKFTYTLSPGRYQWRVRAENGSSQSLYTTKSLVVDTVSLIGQSLNLNNPVDGAYFKTTADFSWQQIYGASSYQILIDTSSGNFSNPATLKVMDTTQSTVYSHLFEYDGKFKWKVKAMNSSASSNYSDVRTFFIDNTPPGVITTFSSSKSSTGVDLSWVAPSTDSHTYTITIKKVGIGTDTANYENAFSYPKEDVSGLTHTFTGGVSGDRFIWRIMAIDKASNVGSYSAYKGFIR